MAPLAMTSTLIRHLEALDGVASTSELRDRGVGRRQLADGIGVGAVTRVRRGWYAAPASDADVVAAVRVGGRVACVSAARRFGWATPERHGLHICVDQHASRLRPARPGAPRPTERGDDRTTLHWWSPLPREQRSRLVTDRFETVLQLARCLSPELAAAAYDSFLHLEPRFSSGLEGWLGALPAHIRTSLPSRDALCHSFLESIGRIRLAAAGITGERQVSIPGVGRVDLVIDGCVVVEWDGATHFDAEQYHADRRRDALLTSMGFRVLRFSYPLVMDEWHLVLGAVRAALAGR